MAETENKDTPEEIKHHRGQLRVLATGSGRKFADLLIPHLHSYQEKAGLGSKNGLLVDSKEVEFGDGEVKTVLNESIRGSDLYVVADCYNTQYPHPDFPFNINSNLMALISAIADVSKEANHVTALVPTFPYARQDRRVGKEPIMSKIVANMLESAGAHQVITFDIHNPAIESAFNETSMENLQASRNIMRKVRDRLNLENLVICSPDAGGVRRAEHYCSHLGLPLVIMHKDRDYTNGTVKKMILVGDVTDKDVLVVDDMAATCGTMEKSLVTLKEYGAKSVHYAVTHAILNREKRDSQGIPPTQTGRQRIVQFHKDGLLDSFYCAYIIDHGDFYTKNADFIVPVSVKKYAAKVIHNLNIGQSLSRLLDTKYVL